MPASNNNYIIANDINSITDSIKGYGVISGCAISASTIPAMTVEIAGGIIFAGTITVSVSATTLSISAADITLPRKDIIIVNYTTGIPTVIAGTPLEALPSTQIMLNTFQPVTPNITAGNLILGEVWVGNGATTITNAVISDRRIFYNYRDDIYDEFIVTDFTNFTELNANGGTTTRTFRLAKAHTSGSQLNSSSIIFAHVYNNIREQLSIRYDQDFNKDHELDFHMAIEDNSTGSQSWLKLGYRSAADPTDKAIGFRIDNLALKGIHHNGITLTVTDLATNLTYSQTYRLKILFTAGSRIEWFVNGSKVGSSTSNLPTGTKENQCILTIAVSNPLDTADDQVVGVYRIRYRREY